MSQVNNDEVTIDPADKDLSADQLDDKYNLDGGGEHPVYTKQGWRESVGAQQTELGYWHWAAWQLQRD